jgi:hypothetical protein
MRTNVENTWKRPDEMLDTCLAAMQQEGRSIEDCLALYPAQRGELEPLLRTAARLHKARGLAAPAPFRAAELERMRSQAGTRPRAERSLWAWLTAPKTHPTQARRPAALRLAPLLAGLLVVALIVAGIGASAASAQALPGDWLYPVKRAQETLTLSLAANPTERAGLHLAYAERRMSEALALVEQKRPAQIEQTLADYDTHLQSELAYLAPGSGLTPVEQTDLAGKMVSQMARSELSLAALKPGAPAAAQSQLENTLAASRQAHDQALQVIRAGGGVTPTPALPTPILPTPTLPAPAPSGTPLPAATSTRPAAANTPARMPPLRATLTSLASAQPLPNSTPINTLTLPASVGPAVNSPTPKLTIPAAVITKTPATNSGLPATATPVLKPSATGKPPLSVGNTATAPVGPGAAVTPRR